MDIQIKHFEVLGDMEEFKKALQKSEESISSDYSSLVWNYIIKKLGRELTSGETRNVTCARLYYGYGDCLLGIRIYHNQNLLFFEKGCSIKKPREEIKNQEKIDVKKLKSKRRKLFKEKEFTVDRLDIEKKCIRLSDSLLQIDHEQHLKIPRILGGQRISVFKKIPLTPYDFYINEPQDNIEGDLEYFCKYNHILYTQGYKTIEDKFVDIDGITPQKTCWIYDDKGLLRRVKYIIETPWNEFITRRIINWYYDFENHLISYEDILYPEKNKTGTKSRIGIYHMDERNFLVRYQVYSNVTIDRYGNSLTDNSSDELQLFWEVCYKNNKLGRVIEYTIENLDMTTHLFVTLKKKIEYDSEGRIFRIKAYNERNRLVTINTYKYLSPFQVQRHVIFKRKRDVPLVEFIRCLGTAYSDDEIY